MSTIEIAVIAVAAVIVLLIVALIVVAARRKRRRDQLKHRYGSEYRRTLDEVGSRRKADERLAEREERRRQLEIRPLGSGQRANLRGRFEAIESSFLDSPEAAVRSADALLDEIAEERGYPDAPAEQRLDDLSVDHPAAVDRYRRSRPPTDGGRASTEQFRQALIASRALFESLLGRDGDAPRTPFEDRISVGSGAGHRTSPNGDRDRRGSGDHAGSSRVR